MKHLSQQRMKVTQEWAITFPTERDGTTSKWPRLAKPPEKKYVTQNLYAALENWHEVNNVMLPLLIINLDIIPKVTSGFKMSRCIKRNKKRSQLDFLLLHFRYAYSKWRYMRNSPQKNPTFRQNNIPLVLQYFQYRPIL